MIQSLSIKNFQCWEDVTFNFSPGVNVLVGESDSGKTAILRALGWVIRNRAPGGVLRWGAERADVTLTLTDGTTVTRSRGKRAGSDEYVVTLKDAEPLVLRAFAQSVPDPVAQALQMADLGWQGQFDSPGFLLTASAGDVARELNRVVRLDVIDRAMSWIGGECRKASAEHAAADSRKATESARLEDPRLRDAEASADEVEGLKQTCRQAALRLAEGRRVNGAVAGVQTAVQTVARYGWVVAAQDAVQAIVGDVGVLAQAETRGSTLLARKRAVLDAQKTVDRYKTLSADRAVVDGATQELLKLGPLQSKALLLRRRVSEYLSVVQLINQTTDALSRAQKVWKTEAPKECPLCGSLMSK